MKLVIIHQHDPTIPSVGGIGTFIDAFIRNTPKDIMVDLIGVTTQPNHFPVGRWHTISTEHRSFRFFPLTAADPIQINFIPLTIRMLLALFRYRKKIDIQDAIIEFHRIEPMLAFFRNKNAKVLFLHGHNLKDFYNKKTEVRWGKFPWLYIWLEKQILPQANHTHIVREDAVKDYKEKYPASAHKISFLPTWVDEALFYSLEDAERLALRNKLTKAHDIQASSKIFLFVGRYEGQKDPIRLLQAFKHIRTKGFDADLILIGDGSLKAELHKYAQEHNLFPRVHFLPPMSQVNIAQWMNAADALCLSSAFEGMPCVIVEALYCGLPVVSTDVGEAGRLIGDSQGGRLVTGNGAETFAKEMINLVGNPPIREACRKQVADFTAQKILSPVYPQHCKLPEAQS